MATKGETKPFWIHVQFNFFLVLKHPIINITAFSILSAFRLVLLYISILTMESTYILRMVNDTFRFYLDTTFVILVSFIGSTR